jgi:hypothetical protein
MILVYGFQKYSHRGPVMKIQSILAIFLLCLFFYSLSVQAEDSLSDTNIKNKVEELETLLQTSKNLSRMISATREVLQSPQGAGREMELQESIDELTLKLLETETSLEQFSAGVDMGVFQEDVKGDVEWSQELREMLEPLMREMKKMTSRPREIENLRDEMVRYDMQLATIETANANLLSLVSHTSDPQLTEKLNTIVRSWQNRGMEIRTQRAIVSSRLDKITGEKKSLSESLRELFRTFFKSRGLNLLVALFSFAFVWVALHFFYKLIQRLSPFHKKGRAFVVRIFDLLYVVFTVVFSFLVLLGVLYSFGDWVLLSLTIIFLLGVGWVSKKALPRFWSQATLMLNFGTVREGEVVVYKGIPFEVISINFHTLLENRELGKNLIRVHINDLMELRSRPMTENEPWFPSKPGDWVSLDGGAYGEIVAQTVDMVKMRLKGGACKFFNTADYLSQSPVNLSSGYRLQVTFGIDYQHQDVATNEALSVFEKEIVEELEREGYRKSIERIRVQFKEAGASSLDVAVLAEFNGHAQSKFWALERSIQRICTDVCTRHQWVIPFKQVTVHMTDTDNHPT